MGIGAPVYRKVCALAVIPEAATTANDSPMGTRMLVLLVVFAPPCALVRCQNREANRPTGRDSAYRASARFTI
jgi:hypothetical protein